MSRRRFTLLALVLAEFMAASCSRAPMGPNDSTWRLLPGRVEPFSLSTFRDGRSCWVYLPPGYSRTEDRYPVLYVNDGESVFDGNNSMHVNRICEGLILRGEIEPLIVVAIASGGFRARFVEYIPAARGNEYLQAIRDTLKPEIDRRYRTLRDPANTAISGFSLGGLISAHAGYAFDSTFGRFAAFSPSYHRGMAAFARAHGRPHFLRRFYQDTGYPDDNSIDDMEIVALEQGFVAGVDFLSITAPGGEHWNRAWEHRMPDMLRFLFPPGMPPPNASGGSSSPATPVFRGIRHAAACPGARRAGAPVSGVRFPVDTFPSRSYSARSVQRAPR